MFLRVIKLIKKILFSFTLPYQFTFIRGHHYLTADEIKYLSRVLSSPEQYSDITKEYEQQMTKIIGEGYGLSYATGRMAFYSLLKSLKIGPGDEVILTGFTCSVMPNAVLRAGATPVYADIDTETYGSDTQSIEKKITDRTRLIVAQHSFGIPCKIDDIVELGRRKGIFVLEDCAIAFDSSYKGKSVGNWGDAAIFSTDHSKPLNTMLGGFFFTRDGQLYQKMKSTQETLPSLERDHQKRIYSQILFESKYLTPENYPVFIARNYLKRLGYLLKPTSFVFFEEDYTNETEAQKYPYPAKMPPFLAKLGLCELARWDKEKKRRKELLKEYLNLMVNQGFKEYLPKAYFDDNNDIVPLRFVFREPENKGFTHCLCRLLDCEQFWFKSPIICSPGGLLSLNYQPASCVASEFLCNVIVNLPCTIPEGWEAIILKDLNDCITSSKRLGGKRND